jgi:hypothetical protein
MQYNAPKSLEIATLVPVRINAVHTGGKTNCWKISFVNDSSCVFICSLDNIVFVDTCYQLV